MEKEKVLNIISTGLTFIPLILAVCCAYLLGYIGSNFTFLSAFEYLVIYGFGFVIIFLGYIATALATIIFKK